MSSNESLESMYEISQGPFHWIMDEPEIKGEYPVSPEIRLQGSGNSIGCALVDENSELLNITRKYSRCPDSKYKPCSYGTQISPLGVMVNTNVVNDKQMAQDGYCGQRPKTNMPDCSLGTESTRLTVPLCMGRERGINRFETLHFDPQKNVSIPFDHNINSDILFRDNHRPCIPVPLDQDSCLP